MIDKIKDFVYDSLDYIIILVVVLVVGGIIGWRLDILFAFSMDKTPISNQDSVNPEINISETIDTETSTEKGSSSENQEINQSSDNNDLTEESKNNDSSIVNVSDVDIENQKIIISIPSGSLGPKIADILMENGLVNNKNEFLNKAHELKLDTKLRSGKFEIEENSSLETIIKILCGIK